MVIEKQDKPPCEEESYGTSAGASNLRVTAERRTPADMIIAAGMNPHRTGLALMRLRTEWDRAAKPPPVTGARIEALARSYVIEPATWNDLRAGAAGQPDYVLVEQKHPYAGQVRDPRRDAVRYVLPLTLAHEEASAWYQHELGLLLQQLKTLPQVRDALTFWVKLQGMEEGVHLVTQVLLWWLSPKCLRCQGTGLQVVKDTGGRARDVCPQCKRAQVAGERRVPHGTRGRELLSFINICKGSARGALQGRFNRKKG